MARRRRCIWPGGCYHLMNRGNDRRTIFHGAGDYHEFMHLIDEAHELVPLPILALCLMPNHFHVVARPERVGDVSRWMKWLLTTHASRFHWRNATTGHVWQGRFKSFPVEPGLHLLAVMRYVDRNPVRANLIRRSIDWPWSSAAVRLHAGPAAWLAPLPDYQPPDWSAWVDGTDESDDLLERLRTSVNEQRPFGALDWTINCALTGV